MTTHQLEGCLLGVYHATIQLRIPRRLRSQPNGLITVRKSRLERFLAALNLHRLLTACAQDRETKKKSL